MMMTSGTISVSKLLAILLDYGRDAQGQQSSLANLAKITGIRYQTLANLINETSSNPRLKTLRTLCEFYGISLDYFACESEEACHKLLKQQQMVNASPSVREIDLETTNLSPKGKRNVLTMMEWMRVASQGN